MLFVLFVLCALFVFVALLVCWFVFCCVGCCDGVGAMLCVIVLLCCVFAVLLVCWVVGLMLCCFVGLF